jgi:hypothetical protein
MCSQAAAAVCVSFFGSHTAGCCSVQFSLSLLQDSLFACQLLIQKLQQACCCSWCPLDGSLH